MHKKTAKLIRRLSSKSFGFQIPRRPIPLEITAFSSALSPDWLAYLVHSSMFDVTSFFSYSEFSNHSYRNSLILLRAVNTLCPSHSTDVIRICFPFGEVFFSVNLVQLYRLLITIESQLIERLFSVFTLADQSLTPPIIIFPPVLLSFSKGSSRTGSRDIYRTVRHQSFDSHGSITHNLLAPLSTMPNAPLTGTLFCHR